MKRVKAVIFDMDGTLLDSKEFIYRAMEDVLEKHGVRLTRQELGAVTGKPVKAMYELLAPHLNSDELELAHMEHHKENERLLKLYPGTVELLEKLKKENRKVGIFTGFNQLTYARLDLFGITDMFDTIVETSRYTAHKPDPEGLLVALDDLTLQPRDCIYVGDGISDMQAGKAGGAMATVGITHGFSDEETLAQHGADFVIQNLSELSRIISELEGSKSGS